MTKILQSKYSTLKNFEEDVTGRFVFKMKRREITRRLFSFSKVLNKVEPLRLADLLIRKKKKIRGLVSSDNFLFKKFRYFYGLQAGKAKVFSKLQYKKLQTEYTNRFLASVQFLEARLDVLLVRLRLFNSVSVARVFIKNKGVLVNNKIIKDFRFCLEQGDILSFTPEYSVRLKRKLYRLVRARPFYNSSLKNSINLELNSVLTTYTWLFKRYAGVSPLLLLGFPRYMESNFNTMEFFFYGNIRPDDLHFPFKTTLKERISFFNDCI